MNKLSLLRSVFIFSELSENILTQLSSDIKEVKLNDNAVIFIEGSPSDCSYIVESGEVIIFKKLGPEQEKILTVLGKGDIFGEMAFFSAQPRTADAKTKGEVALVKITRESFLSIVNKQPKEGVNILSKLLEVVMTRLEQTSRELATIYQTSKVISSGRHVTEIVKGLHEEILLAIPEAQNAVTYLYNEFNQEFDQIASVKSFNEISLTHPLIKELSQNQSALLFNDASKSTLLEQDFLKGSKSFLIVPCLRSGQLLGFIALTNKDKKDAFKNSYSLLLLSVSSQLAEAIENLRFQQEQRDMQRLMDAKQSVRNE